MLTHCLFCHRPLPANEVLERFPVGRRVAYDPARGRLWAVCPACARWSLAPIEERWEALEELERLTRERVQLLARTDNIGLLRTGGLDIVRVGRAELREEAWWRYGREMARRREDYRLAEWVDMALLLTIGMPIVRAIARERVFGRGVWLGVRRCPTCGSSMTAGALSQRKLRSLRFEPAAGGGLAVVLECPYCADARESGRVLRSDPDAGRVLWTGPAAERVLRGFLAYENFTGASAEQVDAACRRIADVGSADGFVEDVARRNLRLGDLVGGRSPLSSLALEIALGETDERALLALEATALEERWKQEEEIAAIMDGELTPLPASRAGIARISAGKQPRARRPGS